MGPGGPRGGPIGNFWTVTQSQVYRELTRMTEHGLVTDELPALLDIPQ